MIPRMAVETVRRRVCDIGGSEHDIESVMTYRIGVDGKLKRVDLCGSCAAPIMDLWRKGGVGIAGPKIATLDEIAKKRVPPARKRA
jgi:hypothetical protein